MKDSLEYILHHIIETEDITVDEDDNDGFITYTIHAPKEYIGKIIGKGGRTINSIKNLLKITAIKEGKKIDVQIAEQVE